VFEPLVFKPEYLFTEFKLLEIIFLAKIDFLCMMTKELQICSYREYLCNYLSKKFTQSYYDAGNESHHEIKDYLARSRNEDASIG
jgi:hypothetical protein